MHPRALRFPALAALAASAASAQSLPPASAPRGDPADTVQLSPFFVTSDQDKGYQAASTLAGTRLNTPIKDLAGSISIYTKDLLDDLGATTANSLLVFATGMESAGLANANFSGSGADINNERAQGDGVRADPQGSSRTRGLASPSYTRGFAPTSIRLDSYNISAYTINRGPNSALFGVGSAAGVVDAALLQADLARNKGEVRLRFGDNDSLRRSADINRVLIPRTLALRLALLHDENKFDQRPAFETQKRIYGTVAWQPYYRTLFRGSFESGHTRANRPIINLPFNGASAYWHGAGRPTYDWRTFDWPELNPAAASVSAGPANYVLWGNGNAFGPIIVFNSTTDPRPSSGYLYRNNSTGATLANAIRTQTFHPVVNRDLAGDTIDWVLTRNIWELPAAFWTGANVAPGQQPGFIPAGIKAETFRDFSAFDWNNRLIDETSRQGDSFRTFNLAFTQTAPRNRAGLELLYDRQRYDSFSRNSFFSGSNSNYVYVDVSVTLPTGQPNPNLGRPFAVYGQSNWNLGYQERDLQRATGFLKYDFGELRRPFARWLGSHTLTGVYERQAITNVSYRTRLATAGAASEAADPGNILASVRRPSVVVYMGPSLVGNNNPVRLDPIRIPPLTAGGTANVAYFQRAADAVDPGRFIEAPTSLVDINNGGGASREVIESQGVVLQSYWLRDHLITTLGWRRDQDFFVRRPIAYTANPADRNDPGKVFYGLDDFAFFPRTPPPSVGKETKTYGVVGVWPRKWLKLPAGLDLRAFYNRSENFTPIGGRVNYFNEPTASPEGTTREYGLNLSALNDRLVVRVNRFETAVRGSSFTPSFESNAVLNGMFTPARSWAQEGNLNPQLAAQRTADLALLFSALPANFRQLYNFVVTGAAPNLAASVNTLAISGSDTADVAAKGLEADLIFNPTPKWRMMLNVAKQETVQSNMIPFFKRFLALQKPIWDRLAHTPTGAYPTGHQPGAPLPANIQTLGQYLDINVYVPYASAIASEGLRVAEQRKWRANFITNYTFGADGPFGAKLKGWGVGGSARWQDKLGIGYPSTRAPSGAVSFDVSRPKFAPDQLNLGAWITYERKIWRDKITWKARLSADNLWGDTDLIPVSIQSWNGQVAVYRTAPERRWYFENTFTF